MSPICILIQRSYQRYQIIQEERKAGFNHFKHSGKKKAIMSFELDENLASNYTIFHRYWICQSTITTAKRKLFGNMKFSLDNGSAGSTVHKCRLAPEDPTQDYGKYFAMKVVSYIKEIPDKKNKDYRPINPYTKTLQQIQTQYSVLQMLNKCHRVAKFQEIIHENPKREDDKEFFYHFLKKPKCIGQRYICLITEFCNEGDLDSIVENRHQRMSEEEVISYAAQIIEGLLELKKKRIIHRDLRLCNILVHNGEVKFSDFDSAFIGSKSNWQDVKNGIDIETSPPQIIELASKPDQQLKKFDPEDLYQRQQKSDIYFFGLALFKMIYGYNYEKFNLETLSNMISEKLTTSKYNQNLLNLLVSCLEEKAQKRIDFFTLYQKFIQIEKLKYFDERNLNKLYLSEEPICFASYKCLDTDPESIAKSEEHFSKATSLSSGGAQIDFENDLKRSEYNRLTALFKNSFAKKSFTDMDSIWRKIQNQRVEQKRFIENMENFIRTISIRSYYYECLYKAILCINLRSLKIKQDIMHVNQSKNILEQELTIVLSFLFKILFKTPFTRDKRYCPNDLPYETMKLFKNIIKSDFIQNKMHCYFGKSRQFDYKSSKTTQKIAEFFNRRYETEDSFEPLYQNIVKLVSSIDRNLKNLLKNTIINLRMAYSNIYKKEASNIKEILFILIALQQINLEKIKKNEIIVVWEKLLPLLNEEVQLDKDQAELIFSEFKKLYSEDELKVTGEHIQYSVVMFGIQEHLKQKKEERKEGKDQLQSQTVNVLDNLKGSEVNQGIQLFQNPKFEVSSIKEKSNVISVEDKFNEDENYEIVTKF